MTDKRGSVSFVSGESNFELLWKYSSLFDVIQSLFDNHFPFLRNSLKLDFGFQVS